MDGPAGNAKKEMPKKEMPKRARNLPKMMCFYEPDPGSPKDDSHGNYFTTRLS